MSNANGVASITEKIMADAQAWADGQTEAARAEADAITSDYENQARQVREKTLTEAKARTLAIMERAKGQGEMDQRKMLLAARQTCLQEAFDEALKKLCALPDDKKIAMMVSSGVRYQSADGEYIFNAADKVGIGPRVVEQVNSALAEANRPCKATLSERTGGFAGGFILKQGDIEANCTFEVLIGGVREALEGETSSILFA